MQKREYWTGDKITSIAPNEIFVFGSNPSGVHGAGAAKDALTFGAVPKRGRGLYGQTYALVTKNLFKGYREYSTGIVYEQDGYRSVSKEMIINNIKELYKVARSNPQLDFLITYQYNRYPNGQPKPSLNGYSPDELIEMFTADTVPKNIIFHESYQHKIAPILARHDVALEEEQQKKVKARQDELAKYGAPTPPDSYIEKMLQQERAEKGLQPYTRSELDVLLKKDTVKEADTSSPVVENNKPQVQNQTVTAYSTVNYTTLPSRGFKPKLNVSTAPAITETPKETRENNDLDGFGDWDDSIPEAPTSSIPAAPVVEPVKKEAPPVRRGFSPRLNVGSRPTEAAPTDEELDRTVVSTQAAPVAQVDVKNEEFNGWDDLPESPVTNTASTVNTAPTVDEFEFPDDLPASPVISTAPVVEPVKKEAPPVRRGFSPRLNVGSRPTEVAPTDEELDRVAPVQSVVEAPKAPEPVQVVQNVVPEAVDEFAYPDDLPATPVVSATSTVDEFDFPGNGDVVSTPESVDSNSSNEVVAETVSVSTPAAIPQQRRGFNPGINAGSVQKIDEYTDAKEVKKASEVETPRFLSGMKVTFIDEVYADQMIPTEFIVDGSVQDDSYVLVNRSGEVQSLVKPRFFESGEDKETVLEEVQERQRRLEAEKILKENNQTKSNKQAKQVVEAPKAPEPVQAVVEAPKAPEPVQAVVEAPKAPEPVQAVLETPKATEQVQTVQNKNRVITSTDPFGDGDEIPDFLVGVQLVNTVVEQNNELSAVDASTEEFDILSATPEEIVANIDHIDDTRTTGAEIDAIRNAYDTLGKVEREKEMSDMNALYPAREKFVRVKDMTAEQLAAINKSSDVQVEEPVNSLADEVQEFVITPELEESVNQDLTNRNESKSVDELPKTLESRLEKLELAEEHLGEYLAESDSVNREFVEEQRDFLKKERQSLEAEIKAQENQLPDPSKYEMFFSLKSPFSNFHPAKFYHDDVLFISTEQFMMYSKAKMFGDKDVMNKVLEINKIPLIRMFVNGEVTSQEIVGISDFSNKWNDLHKNIKALGRDVKPYDDAVWSENRESVVKDGVVQKFGQNKELNDLILSKVGKKFVEASPYDKIWGIGLDAGTALKTPVKDWKGQNLLGGVLDDVKYEFENGLANVQQAPKLENPNKYEVFSSIDSPFNNLYPAKFYFDGLYFSSNEQFMMLAKAQLFNDMEVFDKVLAVNEIPLVKSFMNGEISAKEMMEDHDKVVEWSEIQKSIIALGREVKNYDDKVWVAERKVWVGEGLEQKFVQNRELSNALLATEGKQIIKAGKEAAWGIGIEEAVLFDSPKTKWNGLNLLGELLDNTRAKLAKNEIEAHVDPLLSKLEVVEPVKQAPAPQQPMQQANPAPTPQQPAPEAPKQANAASGGDYNVDDYFFFYSQNSPFSNFHPAKFEFKGIQFSSVEQFYMFSKAKMFKDEVAAKEIMAINERPIVKEFLEGKVSRNRVLRYHGGDWFEATLKIKAIGRKFPRDNPDWENRKENVMGVGIREKFTQDAELKDIILKTKNRILVEASPKDNYWGAGMKKEDLVATHPSNWPGHNALGDLLGKLRDKLSLDIAPEEQAKTTRVKP